MVRFVIAMLLAVTGGGMVVAGAIGTWRGALQLLRDAGSPLVPRTSATDLTSSNFGSLGAFWIGMILVVSAVRLVGHSTIRPIKNSETTSMGPAAPAASATPFAVSAIRQPTYRPFATLDDARDAWNDAVAHCAQGRHATAATIFRRLAEDHVADAALALASILHTGGGDLPPDHTLARNWYEIALEECDSGEVLHGYGTLLLADGYKSTDPGASVDRLRGLELLWRAADAGDNDALAILGFVSVTRVGAVDPDIDAAERVATVAAQRDLLLSDFVRWRILLVQRRRVAALLQSCRTVWRSRAIARGDNRDPRLAGSARFLWLIAEDEAVADVMRFYGLEWPLPDRVC